MSKESAIRWLKQAFHDLEAAEKNISINMFDVSAFLTHQSIEKLFKAILAFHGKSIPRTHNIDELATMISASKEVTNLIEDISADYLVSRYPDMSEEIPFEQYDRELSTQKFNAAKQIFSLLKSAYSQLLEQQ